jgi:hypothetical protein
MAGLQSVRTIPRFMPRHHLLLGVTYTGDSRVMREPPVHITVSKVLIGWDPKLRSSLYCYSMLRGILRRSAEENLKICRLAYSTSLYS